MRESQDNLNFLILLMAVWLIFVKSWETCFKEKGYMHIFISMHIAMLMYKIVIEHEQIGCMLV